MGYTEAFKEQMVKRMLGPQAVSASALSKQVDVPQPTLSQWLRAALERGATPGSDEEKKLQATSTAPKKWTADEKLRVLAMAHGKQGEQLGALLRSEGLHEEQLEQWRQSAMGALAPEGSARPSGAQRKGATMLATLQWLGIAPSFSRQVPHPESAHRVVVGPLSSRQVAEGDVRLTPPLNFPAARNSSCVRVHEQQCHHHRVVGRLAALLRVRAQNRARNPAPCAGSATTCRLSGW
ncbi:transposase [Archangium violaceum]|nr:transposase [Archangium violaceum]